MERGLKSYKKINTINQLLGFIKIKQNFMTDKGTAMFHTYPTWSFVVKGCYRQ